MGFTSMTDVKVTFGGHQCALWGPCLPSDSCSWDSGWMGQAGPKGQAGFPAGSAHPQLWVSYCVHMLKAHSYLCSVISGIV